MSYRRKTRDEWTVQGNYGQGWEDLVVEDRRTEARERLREYYMNESEYPHRIICRRVRLEAAK